MGTRVADRVDEWTEYPFDGGYDGLAALADEGFSGVVLAGGAELYLTKGAPVGVLGGDIEAFDGPATARTAPSPALPLLAVMQAESTEVRDEFYTERTPLSEVDQTLTNGGFTGYIELSENVLSGDYYVVYHAGRSMSVAFVGQSGRLIDGPEAFDAADDEVGLYQVRPVTVEPLDIPLPEPDHSAVDSPTDTPETADTETDEEETAQDVSQHVDADTVQRDPDVATDERHPEADTEDPDPEADIDERGPEADTDEETPDDETADEFDSEEGTLDEQDEDAETADEESADADTAEQTDDVVNPAAVEEGPDQRALELRSIPSLDPDRTVTPTTLESDTASPTDREDESAVNDAGTQTAGQENTAHTDATQGETEHEETVQDQAAHTDAEPHDTEGEDVLARLSALERERDQLRAQLETLRAERDGPDPQTDSSGREISPEMARSAAVVFVRYRSQAAPTLSDVHTGETNSEALRENLTLEIYGGFDDAVTVEGRPYEEFVADTLAYQFVDWMVNDLAFEIQGTGNEGALRDLYDALPRIDRAVLDGTISGEDNTESFDVVFRDSRERPLIVANLMDSHDPVSARQTEQLITAAERVVNATDSLCGAFLVTRSFFDGTALDIADEATKGTLLGRNKRKSFVRASRKNGYHLCLVEAREETPHLAFPEL